jgi:hypothetical protein
METHSFSHGYGVLRVVYGGKEYTRKEAMRHC